MNGKNFEYLKDQVKYSGFGDELEAQLREQIEKQPSEFTLQHQTTFGKDAFDSSLHFKRSSVTDMYFFNSYTAALKQEQASENLKQTFYIGRDNNVTLKEGYNLMSGRAVNKDLTNKEGKIYNAWLQMDFKQTDNAGNFKLKQFHQNYGFDLEKELGKLSIKEMGNNQDKLRVIESLQKGNRQVVTISENGNEQKRYIEANPQFKSVTVYDANQHRIQNKQSQNVSKSKQQDQSVAPDADGEKGRKQERMQKKDKGMSISG